MKRSRSGAVSMVLAAIVGLALAAAESSAATTSKKAGAASKHARAKPEGDVASAAAAPVSAQETALASCKKHVESMLKESAVTRFQSDDQLKIEHANDTDYDISGWVTSQNRTGAVKRMDFICRAQHSSGGLWTTKTSLMMDR